MEDSDPTVVNNQNVADETISAFRQTEMNSLNTSDSDPVYNSSFPSKPNNFIIPMETEGPLIYKPIVQPITKEEIRLKVDSLYKEPDQREKHRHKEKEKKEKKTQA